MTTYTDTIGVSFGTPKTTNRELNNNYLNITILEDISFSNLELNDSFYLSGGYQEKIDFSHLFGNFSLAGQSFIFNTVGELDFKSYLLIKNLDELTLSFKGNTDFTSIIYNNDFTLIGGYQEQIDFINLLGQLSLGDQSFIFNTVGELDFKPYLLIKDLDELTLSFKGNTDFTSLVYNNDFTLVGGYQEQIDFVNLLGQLSLSDQSFIFNTIGELDFKSYFMIPSSEKSSGSDFKIGILIPPNIYILQ
jgi:hypothetical protein